MNKNEYRVFIRRMRATFSALIALCLLFCVLLTVGDGENFPNWDTLFGAFRLNTTENLKNETDFFRVVDIGQGDCMLFYSNGSLAMLDTGPPASEKMLTDKLKQYGVKRIDMLLLSHLESDHMGNALKIADKLPIGKVLLPHSLDMFDDPEDAYSLRTMVLSNGGSVYTAVPGMVLTVGNFEITVLACNADETDANNRSIVAMAEIAGKHILLMGDAESSLEGRLSAENIDLSCDILKVGHHGSNSSTTADFLAECHPAYAVISCGADNEYGHPTDAVLQRLEHQKLSLYRTDIDGDITFRFDGGEISVETQF